MGETPTGGLSGKPLKILSLSAVRYLHSLGPVGGDYQRRGAALRRHCETKLGEAEARVQAIVERVDGTLAMQKLD